MNHHSTQADRLSLGDESNREFLTMMKVPRCKSVIGYVRINPQEPPIGSLPPVQRDFTVHLLSCDRFKIDRRVPRPLKEKCGAQDAEQYSKRQRDLFVRNCAKIHF